MTTNKKLLLLIFIISGILTSISAQEFKLKEFKLKEFKHLENNTNARIHKRRDVNGQHCSILIIKHNFNNFTVEAGKDYEDLKQNKAGETWVWLSPDEYRIKINKQGYIPFVYDLKGKLKSLETYEITITDGYGSIIAKSENSEFYLDGKKVGNDSISLQKKEGDYTLKITRDKYYTVEKYINLKAGDTKSFDLQLEPKKGTLSLKITPSDAEIKIDNKIVPKGLKQVSLFEGKHNIKATKKKYKPLDIDVEIKAKETYTFNRKLEYDPNAIKGFSTLSSRLALGGEGIPSIAISYCYYIKNKHNKYNGVQFMFVTPTGGGTGYSDEDIPSSAVLAYKIFNPRRKFSFSYGINYTIGKSDFNSVIWPYFEFCYIGKKIVIPITVTLSPNYITGIGLGFRF